MSGAGSMAEHTSATLPRFVTTILTVLHNFFWSTVLWILEKLLLTDESLQKQLKQLDVEAESLEQTENRTSHRSPTLEVTEMKDKKLTINIKSATYNLDEDDDYDPPSSADIEVIHRKAPPKLHSILKQRTLSESSDDPGCSGGESPRSGQEECTTPDGSVRKSVSFNSHEDSVTFKKNTAPTSMKTALKSKRRRARKKEEKKAAATSRRRRNSGSETSSGEELSNTDSHSPSDKEEDEHFEQIAEDDEGEKAEGKRGSGISIGAGEGSVKAEKDHQDFRTSAPSGSVVSEKKAAMVEAIKSKVAATDIPEADSDDDEDDSDNERTNNKSAVNECKVNETDECKAVSEGMKEMSVESEAKPSPGDDVISADTISKPGDLQQVIQSQDSSVIKIRAENKPPASDGDDNAQPGLKESGDDEPVKTMLSWKEQGEGEGQEDLGSMDHRTQCAFSFSNSVIYDLDVD